MQHTILLWPMVVIFFFISFFISSAVLTRWKVRQYGWEPPNRNNAKGVIDTGPPFCSIEAERKKYAEAMANYTIPRALYVSYLVTTILTYNLALISQTFFWGSILFLLGIFLFHLMD